jgi:hypothetical protein
MSVMLESIFTLANTVEEGVNVARLEDFACSFFFL